MESVSWKNDEPVTGSLVYSVGHSSSSLVLYEDVDLSTEPCKPPPALPLTAARLDLLSRSTCPPKEQCLRDWVWKWQAENPKTACSSSPQVSDVVINAVSTPNLSIPEKTSPPHPNPSMSWRQNKLHNRKYFPCSTYVVDIDHLC